MRRWRKIGFALLAATMAAPAFADRGGHGRRHGGPAHGPSVWTRWDYRPHRGHGHRFGRGYYIRRAYPYSRYSITFGYPLYSFGYDDDAYWGYSASGWPRRPNYTANGLWLGALAGAVIGHNSGDLGHSAWRGAALGGLTGYVAGSIAEQRARSRDEDPEPAGISPPPRKPSADETGEVRTTEAPSKPSRMAEANRLFGR